MKVVLLLVIVVFSTFVQSYKIRIIRRRYKHKTNRTALVDEQRTVPVHQELQLDNSGHTYQYKRRYYDQAPDETAIKVIPAPRINRVVANFCKDANKDILVVWETVARILGLDKGYPIQHRGELRKLTTIIRTFVTLSKEINFEQMPVHQILQTIDYNLGRVTHSNDITEENIEAISGPYFGIPTLGSSIPGNEETYLEHLETDRSDFNAESLSTETIGVPSLNILEPTNSVNLEDIETELPFQPSIDSNQIESINTGRLVELENGYKIIPATPNFLGSDELITVISPGENAYDDISTEIPLDEETNILPTASSLNQQELITVNTLLPIDSVHDSLEPIDGDEVLKNSQSAEDNSDDEITGNTRRSFGTLLQDQLIMNLIQSSNVTLRKDGHEAIHEDTNLYLDSDNKTPDYLNSHDSAENGISLVGKIIPFDSAAFDEDIISLSPANSEAASLQSNDIDAINSQIYANHLDIDTNTLLTSSNSNLENPVELTPIANDPDVNLVSVSPLYHHENISSEKYLDARKLLTIEEELTISPVALHPDVINSLASTNHIIFRTPDYVQKPFKQITPYNVKTTRMNLDPVKPDDDKTRISTDPIDTSQINPHIMTPYVVDNSQIIPNPAISEVVDTRQTNLDSIISYDEDTSVRNVDPVNPNDVETNQINRVPSVLYDDVDTSHKNLDPTVPYDPIDRNASYDVDTNRRNLVDNYDFDTIQINPDIMAPYVVHTSQRNPNLVVSDDIDAGQTNQDSIIFYDENTSVRNFDPVDPNDVETNQINLGPSVLYDNVDTSHKNLDPTVPYDPINRNSPYDVDTNLRNLVDNYDFETSPINPDIMAPYIVDTSQRNSYPAISHDVNTGQTNQDAIISYEEDKSVGNFRPVDPNHVDTNQINLGPIVLYDDVDTSQKNHDPNVPYDSIDLNTPYYADTNLKNQVNNYDFDTSQINPDIMAPYVVDTSQRNPNPAVSEDVEARQINQDSIIFYDEDTSVRNFDPVAHNDLETNQINLDPSVLYDDIDTTHKNLNPTVRYGPIEANSPYDVDTNVGNGVDNYDFDTIQINPDIMAPYVVDTSQINPNTAVSDEVDKGQLNQDSIISYDEDTSVRHFNPVDPSDVKTNQINLERSGLSDDVNTSQKNLDESVAYDDDINHTSIDLNVPYNVDTNHIKLNPVGHDKNESSQINLDTIASYDVDTSQENLSPTVPYDVDTSQINPDPTVPYNVDKSQKNDDAYDGQKSQINLDTIVSQDTEPSQRNDYPFISQDSATRKSLHLIIPYDVNVQQNLRSAGPDVPYNVGTGRTNLDPIAPYVIDTKQRNLNLVAPYKVGARQVNPHHVDTNQRYFDQAVPYDVKNSQQNLDLTAPYLVEAKQWNRHKINANQITRQRNLETNRLNLELADPYEFDIRQTHPYSSETYDFDVSRKHSNNDQDMNRSQKNLDPIFLYHKNTNYNENDPNMVKNKMAQFSLDNRYNLSPEDNVDVIVFSILPELLSRYSDCKNKARSLIIHELKELVFALESNRCHRSP